MPATPIPVRDDAPLSRPPAPCISVDASALDAIGLFQARPQLRLVAVVDGEHRPVGAVQEIDVRRILFNPFGHALLRNPSYSTSLDLLLSPCPVIEADLRLLQYVANKAERKFPELRRFHPVGVVRQFRASLLRECGSL